MGFRENLKSELIYSGLLVKELAAQTGLKKHTIDNYLSVRGRMPAADAAVLIARALGVTVEYLVTGEENYPDNSPMKPEIRELMKDLKQLSKDDREIIYGIIQLYKDRQIQRRNPDSLTGKN
jgi:transcriptional regulator with XRE-family HTH domain